MFNTVLKFPLPPSYWRMGNFVPAAAFTVFTTRGRNQTMESGSKSTKDHLGHFLLFIGSWSRMSVKLERDLLIKTEVFLLSGRDDFTTFVKRRVSSWNLKVRTVNMLSILNLRISSSSLETSSTLPPKLWWSKCLQKLPNVPWGKIASDWEPLF